MPWFELSGWGGNRCFNCPVIPQNCWCLWRYFPFISWQAQVFRRRGKKPLLCAWPPYGRERESGIVLLGLKLTSVSKASASSSPRLAHGRVRLLTGVLKQSVTQGWLITVSWTRKWSIASFIHAKLWKAGIKRQPVSLALPALSACAQLHSVLETKQTQVSPGHCRGKGVVRLLTFQKDFQSPAEVMEISVCVSKKEVPNHIYDPGFLSNTNFNA